MQMHHRNGCFCFVMLCVALVLLVIIQGCHSSKQPAENGTATKCDPSNVAISPSCYPQAERGSTVDIYHAKIGQNVTDVKVSDPYRALEDPDDAKTKAFVAQLNALSKPYFEAADEIRQKFSDKYTLLINTDKYTVPEVHGDFFYYSYNTGLQNQDVLYQQKTLEDNGTVFLDPNTLSSDGTTAISISRWTEDGTVFAYGLSDQGSDWMRIKFKKTTGEELADFIPNVIYSSIAWLGDNSGVFYSTYPNRKSGDTEGLDNHSLFFHKMGTNSSQDIRIAGPPAEWPVSTISGDVSSDGRFLFVSIYPDFSNNLLHYYDLAAAKNQINANLTLTPLFDRNDASYSVIDSDENSAIVLTNYNASMNQLVRIKIGPSEVPANQNAQWEVLIAENAEKKLGSVYPVDGDKMIVHNTENVESVLYVHDLQSGKQLYKIDIPITNCQVFSISARKQDSQFFFDLENYITSTVIYSATFTNHSSSNGGNVNANASSSSALEIEIKEFRRVKTNGVDTSKMEVNKVTYKSKDGTEIPLNIVHKKGIQLDGKNPVKLYGYGGFNDLELPQFVESASIFIQNLGGIYAVANIRGGGEFGEQWHKAGMREKKQTVFDDFIAAAEYLIAQNYTSPAKLAIEGGSNGGLLTAVCAQQRPDLFGAVITEVGVLDMLRFPQFTGGKNWISEYGDPQNANDFSFIYAYSPLHNLALPKNKSPANKKTNCGLKKYFLRQTSTPQWPAQMLLTADHDDRVVPAHTLKYAAQLYHLLATEGEKTQRNPVLVRIETGAGHGDGTPLAKIVQQVADKIVFLYRVLDLKWED